MNRFSPVQCFTLNRLSQIKILRFIALIPLAISFFTFPLKNLKRISMADLNLILDSEVLNYFRKDNGNRVASRGYFRREWTRLAWMSMEGGYHESNQRRSEFLREARSAIS